MICELERVRSEYQRAPRRHGVIEGGGNFRSKKRRTTKSSKIMPPKSVPRRASGHTSSSPPGNIDEIARAPFSRAPTFKRVVGSSGGDVMAGSQPISAEDDAAAWEISSGAPLVPPQPTRGPTPVIPLTNAGVASPLESTEKTAEKKTKSPSGSDHAEPSAGPRRDHAERPRGSLADKKLVPHPAMGVRGEKANAAQALQHHGGAFIVAVDSDYKGAPMMLQRLRGVRFFAPYTHGWVGNQFLVGERPARSLGVVAAGTRARLGVVRAGGGFGLFFGGFLSGFER